jgi:catechol 2,3-dioxygenase-like lactoylglutathione lyase family enzyme
VAVLTGRKVRECEPLLLLPKAGISKSKRKKSVTFSLKTKISTPLIAETQRFYQTVFGMVVVEEWDSPNDKGVILAFDKGVGEAMLEIYFAETSWDFSGLSLQFKVEDLRSFLKTLPQGTEYEGPKPRPWGANYLYLRDPAGILVIVYEGCN